MWERGPEKRVNRPSDALPFQMRQQELFEIDRVEVYDVIVQMVEVGAELGREVAEVGGGVGHVVEVVEVMCRTFERYRVRFGVDAAACL